MNQRIILGVALLLVPAMAGAAKPSHPVRSGPAEDPHAADFERAKAAVANQLKDPSSVQWKDVRWNARTGAVCGWYNAKNSYGGYVGFQKFAMKDGRIAADRISSSTDSLETIEADISQIEFIQLSCLPTQAEIDDRATKP